MHSWQFTSSPILVPIDRNRRQRIRHNQIPPSLSKMFADDNEAVGYGRYFIVPLILVEKAFTLSFHRRSKSKKNVLNAKTQPRHSDSGRIKRSRIPVEE